MRNVSKKERLLPWDFPGTAKLFWQMWYDITASYRSILDGLDPRTKAEVVEEVVEMWTSRENRPFLRVGVRVIVGVVEKT